MPAANHRDLPHLLHRFRNPLRVAWAILRGNSLYRSLMNFAVEDLRIEGDVLDLGAKSRTASYYRHLELAPDIRLVFSDLSPAEGVVLLDVQKRFPLPDSSFDSVLAFNVFEHVLDFQNAPSEVFRILRRGGRVHVAVPFLHEYHADPDDYVRFTDSGLRQYWTRCGLECERIEAFGEGLLTAAFTKLARQVLPKPLRPLGAAVFYLSCMPIDRLVALRRIVDARTLPQRFALGFVATFLKPL